MTQGLMIFERFGWEAEDKSTSFTLRTTELLLDIAQDAVPYIKATSCIDSAFIQSHLLTRVSDTPYGYIQKISPQRLAAPLLGLTCADSSTILADGAHRYMARWLCSLPTIDWHIISSDHWPKYVFNVRGKLPI